MTGNLALNHLKRNTHMNSSDITLSKIDAREVPSGERLQILPRHFDRYMLTVEYAVYAFMRKLAHQYSGRYWNYFELSNGGFYMAPAHDTPFNVCVDTNGLEGPMSGRSDERNSPVKEAGLLDPESNPRRQCRE